MPITTVLLVRHAQSAPDFDIDEADWPLSNDGVEQARALVHELTPEVPNRLVSSPYRRAIATLEPLAAHLGLPIEIVPDLRERKLADGRLPDWRAQLERSWSDFERALPGGESARTCQRRMVDALSRVADATPGETLAICSHGNAIALFINAIDPGFGFAQWAEMRNPHVFRFERSPESWRWRDSGL